MCLRTSTTARLFDKVLAKGSRPAAAALMVFALALLSLQDAIIKITSSQFSIWQFQFMRSGFNLSLLFGGALVFGGFRALPPKRIWAVALRSFLLIGAMLCFFSGVPFLSLAEIAAGLYLFPLIVTLLSRFVLGEAVDRYRLGAVAFGFFGSLLILKPGTAGFTTVSLLPIGAAFFYAAMVLTTRRLCRDESPVTLALGVALGFMTVGIAGLATMPPPAMSPDAAHGWPYLTTGWHQLTVWTFLAVLACSMMNLMANISLARAYQSAESSWLAPYDYSYLVFAAFWGYVIWGTLPDGLAATGMVMIAAAGIFVATRAEPRAVPGSERSERNVT